MDRFALVPLTAPDEDGRRCVGLFATLEASGDGSTKGSVTWNRAVEAKKPLPTVSKEKLPGVRNRTLVVQGTLLVAALVGALTTGVVEVLLEDASSRFSLVALHERAGMPRQEAERLVRDATERFVGRRRDVIAMRSQLATLLGVSVDRMKMRCARVDGRWIFSRYDGIALLTGEPEQSNTIWLKMKVTHTELAMGESATHCRTFQFDGEREKETPVTDIEGLVRMFLLVPGRRAAGFRRQVSELFVRFVGGDLSLIDDLEKAALVQKRLREEQPNHPATAFGEAASAACDQDELVAKRRWRHPTPTAAWVRRCVWRRSCDRRERPTPRLRGAASERPSGSSGS
jgi:hypothetical protein